VIRGFVYASTAIALCAAVLFAVLPDLDLQVADWFFDHDEGKFPLSTTAWSNATRHFANWIPWLLVLPAIAALVLKLIDPTLPMRMQPSVAMFLLASFLIGPGIVANVVLKDNWGRPRPNHVQQFAGTSSFVPWWQPGGDCRRNCSFVSGEASQAFWTVAPAALAPPQIRPVALAGAAIFGASVSALRVAFGRHFVSDVIFSFILTIAVIVGLYRLLLDPIKRNDAKLERIIERVAVRLHQATGALLAASGHVLTFAGTALRDSGRHLHNRVAAL
jgi:lipid A 4'-phosphatase